jgi:hypothetical protein
MEGDVIRRASGAHVDAPGDRGPRTPTHPLAHVARLTRDRRGAVVAAVVVALACILVVAGLGYLWRRQVIRYAEMRARAEIAEVQLDSVVAKVQRDSIADARQDSADAVRRAEREAQDERALAEAEASAARQAEKVADLQAKLEVRAPELVPFLAEIQREHRLEVDSLQSVIVRQRGTIADLTASVKRKQELNAELQDSLTRSRKLTAYWKGEAKPKLWERPEIMVPVAVAATVVVLDQLKKD